MASQVNFGEQPFRCLAIWRNDTAGIREMTSVLSLDKHGEQKLKPRQKVRELWAIEPRVHVRNCRRE